MIKQVLLVILFLLGRSVSPLCTCKQLLSEQDCQTMASSKCLWNIESQSCQEGTIAVKQTFICDGLQSQECLELQECSWDNGYCTFFTGCTPFTYETDEKCNSFSKRCTSDGIKCVEIGECSTYLTETSCKLNKENKYCVWDELKKNCSDPINCEQLPQNLKSDSDCRGQLSNCTISNKGCVLSGKSCDEQVSEEQCKWNLDMTIECYYYQNKCLDRTCTNAPGSLKTHKECQQYSNKCTIIQTPNSNNQLGGCQVLAACNTYAGDEQCKINSFRKSCIWKDSSCNDALCEDAPKTFTTEKQCFDFSDECTTQKAGGCVKKTTCKAIDIEAACTTDVNGTICFWVNNQCRDKTCEDYPATSNFTCLSVNCLYGSKGTCTKSTTCSNIKDSTLCQKGTDGYCMWLADYENSDGSIGGCFLYSSCESIPYKTHDECNGFSDKCTTNGETCVPITSCDETNINGCFIGNDGNCKVDTTAKNKSQCVLDTSCSQLHAGFHEQCQQLSPRCTTDGQTCIDLKSCSAYTRVNCFFNKVGVVKTDGLIYSTGKCVWDTDANLCRDFDCQDVIGLTDEACKSQLAYCVLYYGKCTKRRKCAEYGTSCPEDGTDGKCITDSPCRLKQCSDILDTYPTTEYCQAQLSQCISDGNTCIDKTICYNYVTQTACNQGGTDGICYFDSNTQKCLKMSQCIQASNQFVCSAAGDRCIMQKNTCIPLTCQNQYEISQSCTDYFDFQYTVITYCQLNENTCTQVNQTIINQNNCLGESKYRNTWNEESLICQSCQYQGSIEIQKQKSTDCLYSKSCLKQTIQANFNVLAAQILVSFLIMSFMIQL